MVSWQKISKYLAGSVGIVGLFAALFLLTGISYVHTGDIECGEICESYINITTSYWRICFENPSDAQRIYEPGVYSLQRTTIGESPDTVLYKKSTRGRTLWVNLNNVNNIISTNPDVIVDWLVPARGAGNWRPIKSGDCWERKKNNRIKLVGHKDKSQTVKWSFDIGDKVEIDPLWIGESKLGSLSIKTRDSKNLLEYKTDFANLNITLLKNDSNNFNKTINDISIVILGGIYKFSGNDPKNKGLEKYLYQVQSTALIIPNGNKPYIRKFTRTDNIPRQRIEERHTIDFSDIANRRFQCVTNASNFKSCNFTASVKYDYYTQVVGTQIQEDIEGNNITINIFHYFLNVTFFSDQFIDPTITISEFVTSESIDTNITQENNFSHLTIDTDQAPYNNLVLYYSFDVNHSTKANITYDYSKEGNDGTVFNATFNTTCLYGNCLSFDGVNDSVDTNNINFNNGSEYSISAWILYDTTSDTNEDTITSNFDLVGTFSSTNSDDVSAIIEDGNWHHVAVSVNSSLNLTFYVDGMESGSGTLTAGHGFRNIFRYDQAANALELLGGTNASKGNLDIGRSAHAGGDDFKGSIDEVMIFTSSLTATEVLDIYNNQSARFKTEGTQEFLSFNVSLTNEDRVNVSAGIQRFFQTNVSLDLGLWNISEGYNDSIDGDGNDVAINDSVVLWFHFDNQTDQGENDTLVFDWSGNGNNGTSNATVNTSQAVFNGSFIFDGIDDQVTIAEDSSFVGMPNLSIVAWVKFQGDTATSIEKNVIDAWASGDTNYLLRWAPDANDWEFFIDTSSGTSTLIVTDLPTIEDAQWHQIVAHYNGTTQSFYQDGVISSVVSAHTGNIDAGTLDLVIGGQQAASTDFWNGSIDEVMIFNRSLSSTEITELYNKGRLNYVYTDPQNLTASNENTTFTISNNTEVISSRFKLYSTNFSDPFYSPILQPNIIYDFFQAGVAADSCTYTSGNWDITCSDNCVLNTPNEIDGNLSLSGNGNVTLNVIMNFTGSDRFIFLGPMCELRINSGGGFN